jgi:type I restriction enzyme M protein
VLFRNEEAEMRRSLVESDRVECVLGLGPGLFYNSPMEACVLICRSRKPAKRQGRILFIDAVTEIARERAQSFLRPKHQAHILSTYHAFADVPGFATVASVKDVLATDGNLSIARYVKRPKLATATERPTLAASWAAFGAASTTENEGSCVAADVAGPWPLRRASGEVQVPRDIRDSMKFGTTSGILKT